MFSAYNLAFSIKQDNPNIQIAIFADSNLRVQLGDKADIFDEIIPIPEDILWKDGKQVPAKIKLSVFPFLPFDYNLILDVDAIGIKDLQPIFDELTEMGGIYYAPLLGRHTIDLGRNIPALMWAYADDIWEKYNLGDGVLPCINSSFQFVKRCKQSQELFEQANKNLDDPISLSKLKTQWGGSQPDELYMDVALCQKGIDPELPQRYLFFANSYEAKSRQEIERDHYLLSMFGNKDMIRPRYKDMYDVMMIERFRKINQNHIYKFNFIGSDKHANIRPKQSYNGKESTFKEALISISKTIEIDHKKLARTYKLPNGLTAKASNWFNCSWIEFKGKRYLAYRIEAKPFCKTIQIGMCLIDDDFQPVENSNVILKLHAELRGYFKGYHVEDPRLFIFRDELYLSYCDGYQMAQAKINPETLEASESFYIDKPKKELTEKNWTFFEYDGSLCSVYNTVPHTIFLMDGSKWVEQYKIDFPNDWKYGIIRGGTTPLLIGDRYLSFFHSSLSMKYKGMDGRQYFMGAYTFSAEPPFTPMEITKEPFICGEQIDDIIDRLNNKIFVVFPSGVIKKDDSYFVSFGYNDYRCKYVEIPQKMLDEQLTPVIQKELA